MEANGYSVSNHILCPDNNGAILLEKKGRKSVGKRSRYLTVRFFCVNNVVDRDKLTIQ